MLGGASFGHDGAGGSIAFAEPDLGVAFSHVTNRMIATRTKIGAPPPWWPPR
jgi:hypothetical protein